LQKGFIEDQREIQLVLRIYSTSLSSLGLRFLFSINQ